MKKLIFIIPIFFVVQVFAQVGVNSSTGSSTVVVNGSFQPNYNQTSSASYTLSVNDYYVAYNGTADATFTLPAVGTGAFAGRVYYVKNLSAYNVTLQPSNSNVLRVDNLATASSFVIPSGNSVMVVNNGTASGSGIATWDVGFMGSPQEVPNTTVFLGGTVYAKYNQASGSTLPSTDPRIISANYSIGNLTNTTAQAGGINSLLGTGYTISNPGNGVFDIKFNTPFKSIYGASVRIVDAYPTNTNGTNPDPNRSGTPLLTIDNAQIAYLDNTIIRIRTGNASGASSNRSFTFLITGTFQ